MERGHARLDLDVDDVVAVDDDLATLVDAVEFDERHKNSILLAQEVVCPPSLRFGVAFFNLAGRV